MIGMTYSVIQPDIYDTFKDGDDFEHIVIDDVIRKKSTDPKQIEYLLSLPKREKRLKALSLRTNDLYEWQTLIDKITGNRVSNIDHLKQIIVDFREFIKRAKVESKLFGEVMTPFDELARPMVNLVKKYDDDFWESPKRVLDSSAGIGTFLVVCAAMFMNGLRNYPGLEDPEIRFKFIVENCLYYGELQSENVSLWLSAIDPYDEYKTNTFWGDFLSDSFDKHMKEVWNVGGFDLVIQNPPYQIKKEGFKKTQPLWHLFVQKSLKVLIKGGYMVMVHPSGWRNLDGVFKETQIKLRENQILELHMHNEKQGLKIFGAETRYDYYILCKESSYKETTIGCQDGSFESADISKMEFIPNGMFSEVNKLIAREGEDRVDVLHSYSSYETRKDYMNRECVGEYKYPCMYTVPKGDVPNLFYSSVNNKGHFGVSKLIWSNGRISSIGSYIDELGEFGLTQFSYAIVDSTEKLKYIKKAFDSKEFRNMMEMCSVGDMSINRKSIATFRKDFWKKFI